jgi:hypothetical protein
MSVKNKNKNKTRVSVPLSLALVSNRRQQAPTARTRRNRRRRLKNKLNARGPSAGCDPLDHAYLRSQVVPFSTTVDGVKVPDSYSFPTSTIKSNSSFNLSGFSATGNQYGIWCFTPYDEVAYNVPSVLSAGGVANWGTTNGASSAVNTNLDLLAAQYRPVAGGVKITCTQPLTAAQGYMYFCHIPLLLTGGQGNTGDFPTTEAQMAQYPTADRYSLAELCERPIVIPFRKVSDFCTQWHQTNGSASFPVPGSSNVSDAGWCAVFVFINSGSASVQPTLNVERRTHLEYVPMPSGTYYGFGDAVAEPLNRLVLDEAVNVGQSTPYAYLEDDTHDEESLYAAVVQKAKQLATIVANSQSGRRALTMASSYLMRRANNMITSYIGAQEEMKYLEY